MGKRPLHKAAGMHDAETVSILLEFGAFPFKKDKVKIKFTL